MHYFIQKGVATVSLTELGTTGKFCHIGIYGRLEKEDKGQISWSG
jgi:hypothetical protein